MSPGRVKRSVVAAKVASIRDLVDRVESLPLESAEAFLDDDRMVAAGESYVRRALEALLDLGRHLLAKAFGYSAVEYKQIATALGERKILTPSEAALLRRMAGYRNRLVHFYDAVSSQELYTILSEHRGDILLVALKLEKWVAEHPERTDDSL